MKKAVIVVAMFPLFTGTIATGVEKSVSAEGEKPLRIAVYVDKGARNMGVFRWIELTTLAGGAKTLPVDGAAIRSGALDAADVLVMPGGSSVDEAKSLGADGRVKIRAFVKDGGGYIGTCAGCSLLMQPSKGHPDMIHMIPFRFGVGGGQAELSIAFNRRATELAGIRKGVSTIRYSHGPVPVPSLPVKDAEVEVVATYNSDINTTSGRDRTSMAGQAAAIAGTYGKGRLFVFAVHPESDKADHHILKGAFRYVSGRALDWDFPQRKRGQLTVGVMCDDSFGVGTARLLQRLITSGEFDVVPLNGAAIEDGALRHIDAILAPGDAETADLRKGFYAENVQRAKEFLARGGRVFAWGYAADAAEKREMGFARVADGEAAIAALRTFVAETPSKPIPVPQKVAKPIRVGVYQDKGGGNLPIARALKLSPEYDVTFLNASDYASGGLEGLDVVLQPGGSCKSQYEMMGTNGVEALRRFVLNGGKYYGVCAGAFMALQVSRSDRPRLGLVPFRGDDPSHYRGGAPIKIALTDEGKKVFEGSQKERTVLYYGGPVVIPGTPVEDTDVKVLARYAGRIVNTCQPDPVEEMVGKAAFLGGRVGKGKVFVSCPHPETKEATFDLVRSGIKFLTGVAPTPVYLDRVRGAVTLRYRVSDKKSAQFQLDTLIWDRRIDLCPGKDWIDLAHTDAIVQTGEVTDADAQMLNRFVEKGGRVVVLCDTPEKRQASAKLKDAITVEKYADIIDAVVRK